MTLIEKRGRLTGTDRRSQLQEVAVRERRLAPVVRRILRAWSRAFPPGELRQRAEARSLDIEFFVNRLETTARREEVELRQALFAPIRKQTPTPLGPLTAATLAEHQIGDLVVELIDQQRKALRVALTELMEHGSTPERLRSISDATGLHSRYLRAVSNLRGRLEESGVAEAVIRRQVDAYTERLLAARAKLIARTEAVRFTNGILLERGRELGYLKQWVSARDARVDSICLELDNGSRVPANEPFPSGRMGPPAHPGCRCILELFPPEAPAPKRRRRTLTPEEDRARKDKRNARDRARRARRRAAAAGEAAPVPRRPKTTDEIVPQLRSIDARTKVILARLDDESERLYATRRGQYAATAKLREEADEVRRRIAEETRDFARIPPDSAVERVAPGLLARLARAEAADRAGDIAAAKRGRTLSKRRDRLLRVRRDQFAKILEDGRGGADGIDLPVKVTGRRGGSIHVDGGVEWIRRTVSGRWAGRKGSGAPVRIRIGATQRAYYRTSDNSIALPPTVEGRAVVHELGHAIETYNPELYRAASDFLDRRTQGERMVPLYAHLPNERGRPDAFIDPYVGRWYPDATEVISMGLEYMWGNPVAFLEGDRDHFDFIWRLMNGTVIP